MPKTQTNVRLSIHSKRQLRALAHKLGMSEGQLVMLAIDRLARDEGLNVHPVIDEGELYEQARRRVAEDPMLTPHADTILYDWPEGAEHWRWVVSASAAEIVDWAKVIEAQVSEEEEAQP